MTLGEYLAGRLGPILLLGAGTAVSALFFLAAGTQSGVVALWLILLAVVFLTALGVDFFRQRSRLAELEALMEGLEQKYLFAECAPAPQGLYEGRLFALCRQAERSMTGAVSQAQAAQRDYREYIESWVHEIKAPITAARLICRRLDGDTRRKLLGELARIEAHVERALFCARAESPDRDLLIRRIGLEDLCAQAIAAHQTLLLQAGVQIETEGLDQSVYTDEKWAAFILGQLLQNAARYREEDPVLTLTACPLGQRVQLTVADNGIGIPAHELPRVFDRGFTGSNGRARGGSTGMGLYLCRRLAAFLEMDIQIASVQGRGTRVTLTFPANLSKL